MKFDYIIIGQGIAGTLLHYFLEKAGNKVLVVDEYKMSSSRISSGIMNPLTGRRYVKSWRYDELVDAALPVYRELERLLGLNLVNAVPIIRALPDRPAEMEWDHRSSLPEYEKYVGDKVEWGEVEGLVKTEKPFVSIRNGYHMHMPELVRAYRVYLQQKDHILEQAIDYRDIEIKEDGIHWQGYQAKNIVFCEGAGAVDNPYFSHLPFNLSKGEAMTVDVPFTLQRVIKHKGFMVPWAKDRMWVGSANFWTFEDGEPTPTGRKRITGQLENMYKGDYTVHKQMAAIKPTVKDRRPFLGTHSKYPSLHIFNGLGTKGASLGPLFAREMANYLTKGAEIDKSVNIQRFMGIS